MTKDGVSSIIKANDIPISKTVFTQPINQQWRPPKNLSPSKSSFLFFTLQANHQKLF